MKRSSVLSRAFFRRPAVRDLVPDLKLVLVVLTASCESHIGVYRPAGLAEDCGFDAAALAGALLDLERRGHFLRDSESGEIFLRDFFRDNSFATPARKRQARDDFAQIESAWLRAEVLASIVQNPFCALKKTDLLEKQPLALQGEGEGEGEGEGQECRSTGGSAAAKKRRVRKSGIVCWNDDDVVEAGRLEQELPPELLAAAVAAATADGKEALPSRVAQAAQRLRVERDAEARREAADAEQKARLAAPPSLDPDAIARGQALLARRGGQEAA